MTDAIDAEVVGGELVLYDTKLFPELKWEDPQAMGRKFGERFDQAKGLDDLFGVLDGQSSKNMVGRKLEISEVEFFAFQADDGVIPRATCQAVDIDSGEVLEFITTSLMCTAFLRKAQLLKLLPVRVRIEEKLTRGGQKALNFGRV